MKIRFPIRHPGIVLMEEFIEPRKLTRHVVSEGTGINQTALGEICRGDRNISIETGLKLAWYFDVAEDYFIRMQYQYEIDKWKNQKTSVVGDVIPNKDSE